MIKDMQQYLYGQLNKINSTRMAKATGNEHFNAYLPPDAANRVKRLRDQYELSDAEIIRRLVQKGLHADSRAQRYAEDARDLGKLLVGLGIGAFAVGLFFPTVSRAAAIVILLVFCSFGAAGLLLSDYLQPEGL